MRTEYHVSTGEGFASARGGVAKVGPWGNRAAIPGRPPGNTAEEGRYSAHLDARAATRRRIFAGPRGARLRAFEGVARGRGEPPAWDVRLWVESLERRRIEAVHPDEFIIRIWNESPGSAPEAVSPESAGCLPTCVAGEGPIPREVFRGGAAGESRFERSSRRLVGPCFPGKHGLRVFGCPRRQPKRECGPKL